MASIILKNVNKSFRNNSIIKNVDIEVVDGECAVLVGPSGCGKSTILRLICGLEDLDSGELYIGDRLVNDLPPAIRGVAMVFQSYALYPHMTVFENMSFSLAVRKFTKVEIENRVMKAAKILKIDNLLDRKPKELSGGQRQRVAIGRAIVRNPFAFLFDEPLSNLDASLRCQMRYELAKLKAQLKTTMIYVTHDQAEAMTLADKIVVMKDGSVEQAGTPAELYDSPINTFVAKFIGSSEMNILELQFFQDTADYAIFQLQSGDHVSFKKINNRVFFADEKYYLGIRPDDIEILSPDLVFFGNQLDGLVTLSENLGGEEIIHVTLLDGSQITVKTKQVNSVRVSDNVRLGYKIEKSYLFDVDGKAIQGIIKGI